MQKITSGTRTTKSMPVASSAIDGQLIEIVYDRKSSLTRFAIWKNGVWRAENEYISNDGSRLVPYSAKNNLIENEVILFPSTPEEYGTDLQLIRDIQDYIHRYVDVSSRFEKIASYYVLLSWIYDNFNELPYLRLRGDYGSGKTRFLLTVGALCCKPIFASGASTISPIFHMLDKFRGTLILDESDFRFSDEKADMVKVLNNGNVKGIPVLRNELLPTKEYNPRAFQVYGPKIVATRGYFDDRALESRFITEEMGGNSLRNDIPINLPSIYKEEALRLRNKLLLYRFRNHGKSRELEDITDLSVEPRLLQIMRPLLSLVDDPEVKREIHTLMKECQQDILADRGMDIEAKVLEAIKDIMNKAPGKPLVIKDITDLICKRYGNEQERTISAKGIGLIVRRQLHIHTRKSHGVFVIPPSEQVKLPHLYQRYGIQ
jgi:hypothetical protein